MLIRCKKDKLTVTNYHQISQARDNQEAQQTDRQTPLSNYEAQGSPFRKCLRYTDSDYEQRPT